MWWISVVSKVFLTIAFFVLDQQSSNLNYNGFCCTPTRGLKSAASTLDVKALSITLDVKALSITLEVVWTWQCSKETTLILKMCKLKNSWIISVNLLGNTKIIWDFVSGIFQGCSPLFLHALIFSKTTDSYIYQTSKMATINLHIFKIRMTNFVLRSTGNKARLKKSHESASFTWTKIYPRWQYHYGIWLKISRLLKT